MLLCFVVTVSLQSMSQSSELEEGEHPESQELSPIIEDEDKNNHKLYTRGVGALLDGMFQDPKSKAKSLSPETPKLPAKEIDTLPITKTPVMSERFEIIMKLTQLFF